MGKTQLYIIRLLFNGPHYFLVHIKYYSNKGGLKKKYQGKYSLYKNKYLNEKKSQKQSFPLGTFLQINIENELEFWQAKLKVGMSFKEMSALCISSSFVAQWTFKAFFLLRSYNPVDNCVYKHSCNSSWFNLLGVFVSLTICHRLCKL